MFEPVLLRRINKKASPSLDERLKLHRETSARIKAAAAELGLRQLPTSAEIAANGMTAVSTTLLSEC